MEESKEPTRYSFSWFFEKAVEGVFVALALFVLSVAGVGILQAHLLPERLAKEGEKMQKSFDEKLAAERTASIKRESELIEGLDKLRKEYASAVLEVKRLQEGGIALPPLPVVPVEPGRNIPNVAQRPDWKNIQEQTSLDPEKEKMRYIQRHSKN
jgi:hypothetical protein